MYLFDRNKMLVIGLLVAFTARTNNAQDNLQQPKPDNDSIKQAAKDIREAYVQDYEDAEQGAKNKQILATKLINDANSEADPKMQFALLKEAIRLQAEAQQAEALIETIEKMSQLFEIDSLKIKVYFLKKIARSIKKKNSAGSTINAIRSVANQATSSDQYDKALELLAAVTDMGEQIKDRKLVREYEAITERTRQESELYQTVKQAQGTLEQEPLNAPANQLVGEWYCLKKNRWEEGVTYLALGNHPEMKKLSRIDLKTEKTPDDLVKLGDLCWDLAQHRPDDSNALKQRAVFWYEKAQSSVSGVTGKKIANRVKLLKPENSPSGEQEDAGEEDKEKEEPLLAKKSKPLTKVKPRKVDAPRNLAGAQLWSRKGVVLIALKQPPVKVAGKNNLYLHPYPEPGRSALVYELDGRYRSFTGGIGVPDVPGYRGRPQSEITFSVIRDGKKKQIGKTSRRGRQSFKPFSLDVTGVKQLILTTSCDGNFEGCFAFWLNPVLSPEEAKPVMEDSERR